MEKASISDLKNRLSAYLQKVRAGETILVFDRNEPIARIERIADGGDDERLTRLRRAGLLAPPTRPMPFETLRQPSPRSEKSVVAALLEEREEGR
jgi:prevent-host-death family protein